MRSPSHEVDVAVVGGGHNALVAAAFLARAGLKVEVFEQRSCVGGFAAPVARGAGSWELEEPHEEVNEAAQDFGLLHEELIEELGLRDHGLRLVCRSALAGLLHEGEAQGVLWCQRERLLAQLPAAERTAAARFLEVLPQRQAGLEQVLSREDGLDVYGALVRSPALLRWLSGSAQEVAREAFGETPEALALATASCSWTAAAPSELGTGLLLLLQLQGAPNWRVQRTLRPVVSAAGLGPALRAAARNSGAEVHTATRVLGIQVDAGRACGVHVGTVDGDRRAVSARCVLSGIDARRTLLELVGAGHLRVDEVRAAKSVVYRGAVARFGFTVHRASASFQDLLDELAGVRLFPHSSVEEIERPLDALRLGEAAKAPLTPWLELMLLDPAGDPAAEADAQALVLVNAHGICPSDSSRACEEVVGRIEGVVSRHLGADELRERPALRRHAAIWEDALGATAGDGFQGVMSLEQMFALRPLASLASERSGPTRRTSRCRVWPTSIEGLDFCGAAAHPGGYVTGLAGRLAARRAASVLEPES